MKKIIGIIAFSKTQENCIRQCIDFELPEQVLISNLENVQGIEKRVILISIGYAPDVNGQLRLNFGPVNQLHGENRLNVLFTRAVKRLEVFTSILPESIGFSENKGVRILRDFIRYAQSSGKAENYSISDPIAKALNDMFEAAEIDCRYYDHKNGIILDCFVHHRSGKIILVNPGVYSEQAVDITAVIKALRQRFKGVHIVLNQDWLSGKQKVLDEVLQFIG